MADRWVLNVAEGSHGQRAQSVMRSSRAGGLGARRTCLAEAVHEREQPRHVVGQLLGEEVVGQCVRPAHQRHPLQVPLPPPAAPLSCGTTGQWQALDMSDCAVATVSCWRTK